MRIGILPLIPGHTLLLVLLTTVLGSSFGYGTPKTRNTETVVALVNVNVVPMDREAVLPSQTVIIRGDRIAAIGHVEAVAVPEDATVIDGKGRYLVPGLADMHVHLDSSIAHARPNFGDASLFLAYGVTTVLNLRGTPEQLAWRQRIQNGELLAPNFYTSGEFVNEPRVKTPEEAEHEVISQADAGYDIIKYHQIVDDKGNFLTTDGFSFTTYMRMNDAARRRGILLIGHAPTNLGLQALLDAHQSLAHVGELVPLYFWPVKHFNDYLLATEVASLALAFAFAAWVASRLFRRSRNKVGGEESARMWRIHASAGCLALMAGFAALCWALLMPDALMFGNKWLLSILTAVGVAGSILTAWMVYSTQRIWQEANTPVWSRLWISFVTLAAVALAFMTAFWIPIPWRSTDAGIEKVAKACHQAGIWADTTLIVYDTAARMSRNEAYLILQDPSFRYLPPFDQDGWPHTATNFRMPLWKSVLYYRYPEFRKKLTAALHREGVPLLAGTDALGFPLVVPGTSLHRELELLVDSGLTPYEALQTATSLPAEFLRKQDEFGTISIGKRADLLLIEGNPLEDITCLGHPLGVMVRGQWLTAETLQQMLGALLKPAQ